jgi:hypothetical protein
MIHTFEILVAFAVSAAGDALPRQSSCFLARWQLKPQHLSPEVGLTTYG